MRRFLSLTAFFTALIVFVFTVSLGLFASSPDETQPTVAKGEGSDPIFLLVGVDEASYSSDVMMLVRMKRGELSFLQIPRDSFVASGNRLNAVFAAACNRVKNEGGSDRDAYLAGGRALSEKLESALGIKVSAHATLTLAGLATMIDAIGGVDVTLDRTLSYEDPAQGLVISLEAGERHLDGAAAEGLVRCRNAYPDADYGRMRAQRKLIEATFHKLRNAFSPFGLISLFRQAYSEVATDLALKDALPLLRRLLSDDTALSFVTLCGESYRHGGALVEVLNRHNLEKASIYLGGAFDPDACRRVFCYDSEGAKALYESSTPPPLSVG